MAAREGGHAVDQQRKDAAPVPVSDRRDLAVAHPPARGVPRSPPAPRWRCVPAPARRSSSPRPRRLNPAPSRARKIDEDPHAYWTQRSTPASAEPSGSTVSITNRRARALAGAGPAVSSVNVLDRDDIELDLNTRLGDVAPRNDRSTIPPAPSARAITSTGASERTRCSTRPPGTGTRSDQMLPIEALIVYVPHPGARGRPVSAKGWTVAIVLAAVVAGCAARRRSRARPPAPLRRRPRRPPRLRRRLRRPTPPHRRRRRRPTRPRRGILAGMRKACADSSALDAPDASGLVLPLESDVRDYELLLATTESRGTFDRRRALQGAPPPPDYAPTTPRCCASSAASPTCGTAGWPRSRPTTTPPSTTRAMG